MKKCFYGYSHLTTGPSYYPKCTLCTGVKLAKQCAISIPDNQWLFSAHEMIVKPFTKIYFIWFKKSSLMTMARKGGMRVKGSLRTSCRALLTRLTFGERRSVSKRPWRPLWLQWYQRRPRPGHLILIVASPGIHLHSIGFITSQLHFGRKWATLHCWFVLN